MEQNIKNLSVKFDLPNQGIVKKCDNCTFKLIHCLCDQAPCLRCVDHSEWISAPKFSLSDDFISSGYVDIDCLPVKDRLFVEALIYFLCDGK